MAVSNRSLSVALTALKRYATENDRAINRMERGTGATRATERAIERRRAEAEKIAVARDEVAREIRRQFAAAQEGGKSAYQQGWDDALAARDREDADDENILNMH